MKDAQYSIKDLEKLTGIKAHTLRIWEKRYGILYPERSETNIRHYTDKDLKKLLNISLLNKHGYKISLLAKLSDYDLNEQVLSLTQNDAVSELQLDSLITAMIELDESKFDKIINNAIIHYGFEETICKVIRPLFEKIGILWQTNTINPAHEHFISNLIRQKILVATDGIIHNSGINQKTFFVFLPEGEWHEIGLLIHSYFIKKAGHKIIYFGQSLPFPALVEAAHSIDPDFILTILTCSLTDNDGLPYIQRLSTTFDTKTIFISGIQVKTLPETLPDNVKFVASLPEFKQILTSIQ